MNLEILFLEQKKKKRLERRLCNDNAEKLNNTLLTIYFNQYNNIADT